MKAADKIWIYYQFFTKEPAFKEILRDDPRLEWDAPGTPPGTVRYSHRKGGKWTYANFGNTKQEAADSANRYDFEKIAKLEAEITRIKARLVKP
jgi:hypothetical protein